MQFINSNPSPAIILGIVHHLLADVLQEVEHRPSPTIRSARYSVLPQSLQDDSLFVLGPGRTKMLYRLYRYVFTLISLATLLVKQYN